LTRQVSNLAACIASVAFIVALPLSSGLAADDANYSGKYSLQGRKAASGGTLDSSIEVVQNEDSIEITTVEKGIRTTNRYPLNGSDGEYKSPGLHFCMWSALAIVRHSLQPQRLRNI
jgi:hypothetical protein